MYSSMVFIETDGSSLDPPTSVDSTIGLVLRQDFFGLRY
jgi:hypothetical protein